MSADLPIPAPAKPADPAAVPVSDGSLSAVDVPVVAHKLDADLYTAGDLDGITESLFGSGNLNYLLLQARQTDAAAGTGGGDGIDSGHADPAAPSWLLAAAQNLAATGALADAMLAAQITAQADSFGGAGATGAGTGSSARSLQGGADGNGSAAAAQIAAAPIAADGQNTDADTNNPDDDNNDNNNNNGNNNDDNGNNNGGNNDGDNGGNNGGGSGNAGDIDILADNNIGLPVVDINLDPLENITGDIDLGLGITFDPESGLGINIDTVLLDIPLLSGQINLDIPLLNPVIAEALELANPILTPVTDTLQPMIDGISVTVESLLGSLLGAPPPAGDDYDLQVETDLGIPDIHVNLDVIENMIGDIDIGLGLAVTGEDGIQISLETIVADLPVADLNAAIDLPLLSPLVNGAAEPLADTLAHMTAPDTLAGILDNPAEALPEVLHDVLDGAAGIIEGTVSGLAEVLHDTLQHLGQTDNSADDYDLALHNNLGLPQIDVNLDTVENITGDIDIGVSVSHGADGITIGLDTTLAGIEIINDAEITLDIPLVTPLASEVLDIAQGILGEAASDEGAAHGAMALLDDAVQGIEDILSGVLGSGSGADGDAWPQLDAGALLGADGLGDLVGGITDGALQLPEPVGNIVEGLGLLPSGGGQGGGLLSGLFSGHGGGLFG